MERSHAGRCHRRFIPIARSRTPDPTPAAPGGFLPEDPTLEERTRYLLQKIDEDAGFLEQWIVHYLAELLERADDREAAPRARSEARAEIARVMPALWEQQIGREAVQVRQRVDWWLRRTDTLDFEAEQLLAPLLVDPQAATDVAESQAPDTLRALHTLGELVSRFVLATASAKRTKDEVTSEAIRRFLKRDEEVQGLQAGLARIVPDFAALDLTDLDAVGTLAYQTLLALTQAQLALLTRLANGPKSKGRRADGLARPRGSKTPPQRGPKKRGSPSDESSRRK